MQDDFTLEQFRKWGAQGGKAKAKKYTRKQLSEMAKLGKKKRGGRRKGSPWR